LGRYLNAEHSDLLEKLSYLKVDTEGHDRDVILSMKEIILKHRPAIRAEVVRTLSAKEAVALYDTLKEMGYKVFEYQEKGDAICGEAITPENIKRDYTYDIIAVP
jgi:hypothetical protein